MKKTTPVEELNIEKIANNIKVNKDRIQEESRRKYKEELDKLSLYGITEGYDVYLFPFSYVLDRLNNDFENDKSLTNLQIKEDIVEQLSKMGEVPDFDTICHIESIKLNINSSVIQFIQKVFTRQKKYKIVFHNKNIDLNKKYNTVCGKEFLCIFGVLAICLAIGKVTSIGFLSCFSAIGFMIVFTVFLLFFLK